MFHRTRSGLQIHPITTSAMSTSDDEAAPLSAASDAPVFQPEPTQNQKEVSSMTNTPSQTDTPSSSSTESSASTTATSPHVPTTAAYSVPSSTARTGTPQPMARSPYSYGGAPSFGGSSVMDASISTGRKLIVGEGIAMSGEIESCDHLIVEGTVEATLKGASVLEIAQSGMFFGAVEINEATIAGRFEGDLVVNGRLTLRATGTVSGTLSYKELAVEAGATIEGKISPMREGQAASTANKKPSQKQNSQNDTGSELPFAKSQVAA